MEKLIAQHASRNLSSVTQGLDKVYTHDSSTQEMGMGAGTTDVTPQEARKVLRKLDLILMPLLGFYYLLQFLDKSSLNYAALLGILKDTAWTASIFYFGYLFWSFPTAYLVVRLPIGKYLAGSVLLWGGILMCHSACHNFTGLMIPRFFLGATEAAVAPGFSLLTGMSYTRKEQPFRHGLWFCGNSLASIVGGVLAYAIGGSRTSLAPWRLLFLIFGASTVFWAFVMLLLLPSSPSSATFLSKKERVVVVARVLENKTGVVSRQFKRSQMLEALKDPKSWLLIAYIFCVNLPNRGLTAFGSLVIAGFGYKGLDALLLQMPAGVTQLGFVLVACLVGSKIKNVRLITMIILTLISAAGMAMIYALPPSQKDARLGGYCLSMAFAANMPLGLSLISSNVAGFTKKSTVNGAVFVAYCVGNIVGPQFYLMREAPRYPTGIKSSLAGFCIGAVAIVALLVYLIWENKRRNKLYGPPPSLSETETENSIETGVGDLTDWERQTFRYVY